MSTPDPETIAAINTAGAIAYAQDMGEAMAAYYRAMVENGLPKHLADAAVIARIAEFSGYDVTTRDPDDEDDDEDEDDEDD